MTSSIFSSIPFFGASSRVERNFSEAIEAQDSGVIENNSARVNELLPNGKLPIHLALSGGKKEALDQLIRLGANPCALDSSGITPLERAVLMGKENLAPALLGKEADGGTLSIDPKSYEELKKMFSASEKSHKEVIALLSAKGAPQEKWVQSLKSMQNEPLFPFLAAAFASEEKLDFLLKEGIDFSGMTMNGMTPLHYAAFRGNQQNFQKLVRAGVSPFLQPGSTLSSLSLLIHEIKRKDPLSWNYRELTIFMAETLLPLAEKVLPREWLALKDIFSSVLSVGSFYSNFSLLLEERGSLVTKLLWMSLYFGTSWIPLINIPITAYNTYFFVSKAWNILSVARSFAADRPLSALKATIIKTSNAVTQTYHLWNNVKLGWNTLRIGSLLKTVVEEGGFEGPVYQKCGKRPDIILNTNGMMETNPGFPTYVDCATNHLEEAFAKTAFWDDEIQHIIGNQMFPMFREIAKNCPESYARFNGREDIQVQATIRCIFAHMEHYLGSERFVASGSSDYTTPLGLSKMSLEERVQVIGPHIDSLQKALDLIQKKNVCEDGVLKFCRDLSAQLHIDKNPTEKEKYEELSSIVGEACNLLRAAYQRDCTKGGGNTHFGGTSKMSLKEAADHINRLVDNEPDDE